MAKNVWVVKHRLTIWWTSINLQIFDIKCGCCKTWFIPPSVDATAGRVARKKGVTGKVPIPHAWCGKLMMEIMTNNTILPLWYSLVSHCLHIKFSLRYLHTSILHFFPRDSHSSAPGINSFWHELHTPIHMHCPHSPESHVRINLLVVASCSIFRRDKP